MREEFAATLADSRLIYELVGHEFNIGSPPARDGPLRRA
jgi:hypothetical protein